MTNHINPRKMPASIFHTEEARAKAIASVNDHPQEHESLDAFVAKVESAEARAAVLTLLDAGYTYHGGIHWKPPIGKKPDFAAIDHWRNQNDAILQAIADPENQPSQYGTVTIVHMEAYAAEAVRQERERCVFFIRQSIQQCKEAGQKAQAAGKHHMVISMEGAASILQFSLDEILCVFDEPKDHP